MSTPGAPQSSKQISPHPLPSPLQVLGVSIDSQFTHLAWIQTDRKSGGLGDLAYPLVADLKKEIW